MKVLPGCSPFITCGPFLLPFFPSFFFFVGHVRSFRRPVPKLTGKPHVLYLLWYIGRYDQVLWAAVRQLVEAPRYKFEVRGFDSLWCQWNFSLTQSFRPYCGPGVDSASNRNEYQEYFLGGKGGRCVGLTTLPRSRADCLEILEPEPPGTLRACPGL